MTRFSSAPDRAGITARIVGDLKAGVRPGRQPRNAEHAAGRISRPLRARAAMPCALLLLMTAPAIAFDKAFLDTWAHDAPSFDWSRGGANVAAATTAADDFAGTYASRQDSYEWTATITAKGGQSYAVRVQVRSTLPACMGDIEAIGTLHAGRIVTGSTDPDDVCVLTISRTATGIDIEEAPGCRDHGAACSFDSRLTKVRK